MSNKQQINIKSLGFTLVELSIVIIIIGFLIAGVAGGLSLVKQAKMSSVVTELQNYQTSYNSFRLRYNAPPGDMKNGSAYWPAGANGCAAADDNLCNGDGNGVIDTYNGVKSESAAAWRELALAGMIEQVIPPLVDTGTQFTIGQNMLTSKLEGVGYLITGTWISYFSGAVWNDGTNGLYIARPNSGEPGIPNGALKPEEAFNLDSKIDDGAAIDAGLVGASTGNFQTVTSSFVDGIGWSPVDACLDTNGNYSATSQIQGCTSSLALKQRR